MSDEKEAGDPAEKVAHKTQEEKFAEVNTASSETASVKSDSKPLSELLMSAVMSSKQLQVLPVAKRPRIIGDWFKGGDIGYVFAKRGVGKTWFSMAMARSIASGKDFGVWPVHDPQRVLYIDGEVSLEDTKARDVALSSNDDDLLYLHHEHLFNVVGKSLDITKLDHQNALLDLFCDLGARVVVLDNLSCLAPTLDENEGTGFSSQVLNFVLAMRRRNVASVFVQHAGRNGEMRGNSRREDASNWMIRLDDESDTETVGACFVSVFTKNRNSPTWPQGYEWRFTPDGSKTIVTVSDADPVTLLAKYVRQGIRLNKELAEHMNVSPGQISKLAKLAEDQGKIEIHKGKYEPVGTAKARAIIEAKIGLN